jgi:hypothetical protein
MVTVFLHVSINCSSPLSYVSSGGKHAYAWWCCKYIVWVVGVIHLLSVWPLDCDVGCYGAYVMKHSDLVRQLMC